MTASISRYGGSGRTPRRDPSPDIRRPGQNLNLQIQRLEADLGGPLLVRWHRYQAIAPTPLGRRVLDQLRQPDVRAPLDEHAPPGAHQPRSPSPHAQQPND